MGPSSSDQRPLGAAVGCPGSTARRRFPFTCSLSLLTPAPSLAPPGWRLWPCQRVLTLSSPDLCGPWVDILCTLSMAGGGVCAQSSPHSAVGRKQHPSARSFSGPRAGEAEPDPGARHPGLRCLHPQPHVGGTGSPQGTKRGWERETPAPAQASWGPAVSPRPVPSWPSALGMLAVLGG